MYGEPAPPQFLDLAVLPDPRFIAHKHAIERDLEGTAISVTILSIIAVCLRFWARTRSRIGLGWDDWLMIPALIMSFGNLTLVLIMARNSMGLPMSEVPLEQVQVLTKSIFAAEFFYFGSLTPIKLSILIMYCRAFSLRSVRIGSWTIGTLVIMWAIFNLCICIFQCKPIEGQLHFDRPSQCISGKHLFVSTAMLNIVTDVMILTLPIYHVWKLHLPRIQRFTVMSVFLLGCFVVFASTYRLAIVLSLATRGFTFGIKQPTIWSHIEICVAIVSTCLPCMRPLLKRVLIACRLESRNSRPTDIVGSVDTIGGTKRPRHKVEPTLELDCGIFDQFESIEKKEEVEEGK